MSSRLGIEPKFFKFGISVSYMLYFHFHPWKEVVRKEQTRAQIPQESTWSYLKQQRQNKAPGQTKHWQKCECVTRREGSARGGSWEQHEEQRRALQHTAGFFWPAASRGTRTIGQELSLARALVSVFIRAWGLAILSSSLRSHSFHCLWSPEEWTPVLQKQ